MPIASYISKYRGTLFLETGTGRGDGVLAALQAGFRDIHSIEISRPLYDIAQARILQKIQDVKHPGTVMVYHGDSLNHLRHICEENKHASGSAHINHTSFFTIWLDAQATVLDDGQISVGSKNWPVVDELRIIRQSMRGLLRKPAIFINGFPQMSQPQAWGGHDVTIGTVTHEIQRIDSSYEYHLLPGRHGPTDILAAIPGWLRASVSL